MVVHEYDIMYTLPAPSVYFRPVEIDQVDAISQLESASYPSDEAATPEKLSYRAEHAKDFFLVAIDGSSDHDPQRPQHSVIGFVCSTLTASLSLTHESMSTHDPDGKVLCIHSVVIEASRRRQNIGSRLMTAYINFVKATSPHVEEIRLLCKQHLVRCNATLKYTPFVSDH